MSITQASPNMREINTHEREREYSKSPQPVTQGNQLRKFLIKANRSNIMGLFPFSVCLFTSQKQLKRKRKKRKDISV